MTKSNGKILLSYITSFSKWLMMSAIIGVIGGVIGSLFHHGIDMVTHFRENHNFIILLLPLGGLVIALLYRLFSKKGKIDTNRVIESVRGETEVPLVMVPLIFIGAIITHAFGGSAGREGAALQLGGGIGYNLGKAFRLQKKALGIVVMAGMSAVFAALFGTPITAAVFALEVTEVGKFRYTGLFPCVVSAVIASKIALAFGLSPVQFLGINYGQNTDTLFKVAILAILCAVLSILFCLAIEKCEEVMDKIFTNCYLRAFCGGAVIVALTFLVRSYDYNGAGMNIVEKALSGEAIPYAFALKIIFTAITVAAGFKGGEIVPAFFIGSTFGCAVAPILGLDGGMAAAIGFVAVFCGLVNCPLASMILAIEVFGTEGFLLFAIACSVSYLMSGHFGLYNSQKIIYNKAD